MVEEEEEESYRVWHSLQCFVLWSVSAPRDRKAHDSLEVEGSRLRSTQGRLEGER